MDAIDMLEDWITGTEDPKFHTPTNPALGLAGLMVHW